MNFVRARSVIEKLMPTSEITLYGKGNMQERLKTVCLISNNLGNISNHTFCWFRINVENISNHAYCLMKVNRLKEEHNFNEISPKDPKMNVDKTRNMEHSGTSRNIE